MKIQGHGYAWVIDVRDIPRFRLKRSPPIDLGDNMFVISGQSELGKLLARQSGNFVSYIGVGSGISGPTQNDTTLGAEIFPTNALRRGVIKNVAGSVFSCECEWEVAAWNASQTFTEFGLFSASTGGIMFDRIVYATGLVKSTSQILVVKIDIGFN